MNKSRLVMNVKVPECSLWSNQLLFMVVSA